MNMLRPDGRKDGNRLPIGQEDVSVVLPAGQESVACVPRYQRTRRVALKNEKEGAERQSE
jgi:hypothetical protein